MLTGYNYAMGLVVVPAVRLLSVRSLSVRLLSVRLLPCPFAAEVLDGVGVALSFGDHEWSVSTVGCDGRVSIVAQHKFDHIDVVGPACLKQRRATVIDLLVGIGVV